jgi:hypothetical protein
MLLCMGQLRPETNSVLQSASEFTTKDEFEVGRETWSTPWVQADSSPQKELVRHIETTLARSLYNCDEQ